MEDEPSSLRVRDLFTYLKYLGVKPRKLVDWSDDLHYVVEEQHFFMQFERNPKRQLEKYSDEDDDLFISTRIKSKKNLRSLSIGPVD